MTERDMTYDPNSLCLLGIASTTLDVKRKQEIAQSEVGIATPNQGVPGIAPIEIKPSK